MNVYVPFICLALGAAINWKGLPKWALKLSDVLMNGALILLMVVIGMNMGTSEEVMSNLGKIGLNCLLISLTAVVCSVALVFLAERTVMPLEKIRLQLAAEKGMAVPEEAESGKKTMSPLVLVMPGCIVIGLLVGRFIMGDGYGEYLDVLLTVSLLFLYTGVGVSLASNKEVFQYVRRLGLRVLFMPAAIFIGCIIGGYISGAVLGVPIATSVISASGMGYYSLTGAFLTETYGVTAGTYGFIVNVLRDVLTVALLPVLIKISKGSAIASGAAGCMDTMLLPVTKFVGPEMGLVALISGTILTFVVPVWLPISVGII